MAGACVPWLGGAGVELWHPHLPGVVAAVAGLAHLGTAF